jgi:hypothetical protein
MLSINKIHITPGAGCALDELKQEMSRMSDKYNCEVTARFNGTDLSVKKLDYPVL